MKKCLACHTIYPSLQERCPSCSVGPKIKDGFPSFLPYLAEVGDGFKPSYFADLARLEARNFWFRVRNRAVVWALHKYCPGFQSLLEIGCGTGYVLSGISEANPTAQLHGSEIFTAGLAYAAARLPLVEFVQMDARAIAYFEEFDVIGAFDVLEHIEDDSKVLAEIHQALMPCGVLLLTVPQHPWLWSSVDDYACHVQRYTARVLHGKLKSAGFEILRSTSFVSSLLPLMFASRLLKRWANKDARRVDAVAELDIAPWLNCFFEKLLSGDLALIRSGVDLPFGGSRLIVAKKI